MEHVKREANECWHLVKVVENVSVSRSWMEEIPDIIHDVVILEQYALVD